MEKNIKRMRIVMIVAIVSVFITTSGIIALILCGFEQNSAPVQTLMLLSVFVAFVALLVIALLSVLK